MHVQIYPRCAICNEPLDGEVIDTEWSVNNLIVPIKIYPCIYCKPKDKSEQDCQKKS